MAPQPNTLSIVIPALNEEEAIRATVERCLRARGQIQRTAAVHDVEVIVVSDGSTDRTEEIARSFEDVTVLVFELNRGYGAAIKCGFEHARGDIVGFLDADGTCDPEFFGPMIAALRDKDADLVLGSRMGPKTKMPLVRTIGNRLFAWLLSAFSLTTVRDTASGMRVIRREALQHLYPLPDGLHFTPAMSARALLEGKLRLIELPMPYAERTGQSKLRVLQDGVRFLTIIVLAAITFRPARPLLMASGAIAAAAVPIIFHPAVFYLANRRLEEWVIYRVLFCALLATVSGFLVCAAAIADRVASAAHGRWIATRATSTLHRLFESRVRVALEVCLVVAALAVIWPGLAQYARTGHTDMHWSRAVLGSLLVVLDVMLVITGFLLRMMNLIEATERRSADVRAPDRVRPGRSAGEVFTDH